MLPHDDKQTILVIDDDPTNLSVAFEYLRAFGYRVLTARDGELGIARAHKAQPDLILLDVGLPGIDGFETCRRLCAAPETRHIAVIFMTGHTALEDKVRGFEVGGVDYVTKPVEQRELLGRARAHLKIRRQQVQLERYASMLRDRVADSEQIVEHEKAHWEATESEAQKLRDLLQRQGLKIQALTERWLLAQGGGARAGAGADGVKLLRAHLEHARAHSQPDAGQVDLRAEATQRHVSIALELLAMLPVLAAPATPAPAGPDPFEELSDQERRVVVMLVSGRPNKEIAFELEVSTTTVSTYRKRILDKLSIDSLPELVKLALKFGLAS